MNKEHSRKETVDQLVSIVSDWIERFDYNPGHSDLDNEQPESLSVTLGEIRKVQMLLWRLL